MLKVRKNFGEHYSVCEHIVAPEQQKLSYSSSLNTFTNKSSKGNGLTAGIS